MDSNQALGISGRIIAEFEDDASQFLSAEPQFVPAPAPAPPIRVVVSMTESTAHSSLSGKSAALAKEAWMRIIKRYTEPVQGEEGCVQVHVSPEYESGSVRVSHGGRREGQPSCVGRKLDVGDDVLLTIFDKSDAVTETASSVAWTDIDSIDFSLSRPLKPKQE